MTLQFHRGPEARLPTGQPDGHPLWTTDTQKFFIAQGGTNYQIGGSIALTMPSEFSVAGSPITAGGTFTVTKANQSANIVYAGPSSGGAAAPTFRALVSADMPASGAGSGTVTSVAISLPSELSVTGSPITSSGTFTVTKANQSANIVFAGPSSGGAAAPTFRALANADMPASGAGSGTVTSVALSLPSELSVSGSPITAAGTFTVTKAVQNANFVFAGPSSGGSTAPTFRALANADMPASGAGSGTVTSVALSMASGVLTFSGSPITSSGTITISHGEVAANLIFAGPTSGGTATPTYRSLVAADVSASPDGMMLVGDGTATGNWAWRGFPLSVCEGRLSLTSGTPVDIADLTGGTLFFSPYKGSRIMLYDATRWRVYTFTTLSLALTVTSGKNYDAFIWDNGGTLAIQLSTAWTSDTARADAISLQNGVLVNTNAISSMGATRGRYVGTIRASAANTVADQGGGSTTQVGGKRFVWNYYNRVPRFLQVIDTTSSWTQAAGNVYRIANAVSSPSNSVEFVVGYAEDSIQAIASGSATNDGVVSVATGIGLDSGTVQSGLIYGQATDNSANNLGLAVYQGIPATGYHYLAWLERGGATGTTTWRGNADVRQQYGLQAMIRA